MSLYDVPETRGEEPLPPIDHHSVVESAYLAAFERISKGEAERIRADIEEQEGLTLVLRLRGPRCEPLVRRAYAHAAIWVNVAAALVAGRRRRR